MQTWPVGKCSLFHFAYRREGVCNHGDKKSCRPWMATFKPKHHLRVFPSPVCLFQSHVGLRGEWVGIMNDRVASRKRLFFVWVYIIMTIVMNVFLGFKRCYSAVWPSWFSHIQWGLFGSHLKEKCMEQSVRPVLLHSLCFQAPCQCPLLKKLMLWYFFSPIKENVTISQEKRDCFLFCNNGLSDWHQCVYVKTRKCVYQVIGGIWTPPITWFLSTRSCS